MPEQIAGTREVAVGTNDVLEGCGAARCRRTDRNH